MPLKPLFVLLNFALAVNAFSDTETWNAAASSRDWNTGANWSTGVVPNGPADTAIFGVSNVTSVTTSAPTEVEGIVFEPGASVFTIQPGANPFMISGTGFSNQSGITQNLKAANGVLVVFSGSSTAGDNMVLTTAGSSTQKGVGGQTVFAGSADAGHATLITVASAAGNSSSPAFIFQENSSAANCSYLDVLGDGAIGSVAFDYGSTAANGTFRDAYGEIYFSGATAGNGVFTTGNPAGIVEGSLRFDNTSTADHAEITLLGGVTGDRSAGAQISFLRGSTAANASVVINGGSVANAGGASGFFYDLSTGGDATFTLTGGSATGATGGRLVFYPNAERGQDAGPTAENATVIASGGIDGGGGANIEFEGNSSGGTARLEVFGNATLTLRPSAQGANLTVGSLEGDGSVLVQKDCTLIVGGNGLGTTFSGAMKEVDGALSALTKTGNGLLKLAGANTYSGVTTVLDGTLEASNAVGSATGLGAVHVQAGTLGGGGTIAGDVTIGSGAGAGANLAPALGHNKQRRLTIQGALVLESDATFVGTFQVKNTQFRSDRVTANGVTISEATISLAAKIVGTPQPGLAVTVIDNTSVDPIFGRFANLPDEAIVTLAGANFQASYEGADGNDLTLALVP